MSPETTDATEAAHDPSVAKAGDSLRTRLYHGTTKFDFVGRRKIGFAISGVILALSLLSLLTRQLNLGIDFKGGVSWEYDAHGTSAKDAESVLSQFGLSDGAKVQTLTSAAGERIRVQVGPLDTDKQQQVRDTLATKAGVDNQSVDLSAVSASWGSEITHKAVKALIVFFVLLTVYIALRFEWKMAVAAFVAVLHDVLISVGVYSIFGFEVTPATVIAFLTILGYSLYDTIVVFDKVHDNTRRMLASGKSTYGDIVNLSMNQVLMRSLNTSLAAVLPVGSLLIVGSWIMGARALQDFALALFVGLITGSYSSIYIATPVLAAFKEREPRYKALRVKLGRTTDVAATRQAALSASRASGSSSTPSSPASGSTGSSAVPPIARATGSVPPRPRKQKRR